jgi:hypothetical protein
MNPITEFLHMLQSIPASFWGVVIGSFFSIGGVALTNRASDRRLRLQFEHERGLKTKDREMELRKEVYLAAAEAIAAGLHAISRFPNLDIPNDQITNAFIEKSPAISKIHVIATTETVQALTSFTGQLGALFLTLFAQRYELQKSKSAIIAIDSQVAEFGKERDRMLEMIKQHNIEGIVDDRRWNTLQNNFDFEQKRIRDGIANQKELHGDLYPRQLEFMRDCVTHTARLSQLLIPVLSSVRAELDLPLDDHAYRAIAKESLENQQAAIDAFVLRVTPTAVKPINPPEVARHQ